MTSELPTVPVRLRVHLAHATVQAIADEAGADILHIKGPAVDPTLRPHGRSSADADVLVRPAHLKRFFAALHRHDWRHVKKLRAGGLVQHSANWHHGQLGQMDVHVRFPGIQIAPAEAFEVLWRNRGEREIAGRPCVVPDVVGQRLILLLHAARDLRHYQADVQSAWLAASDAERDDVRALACLLDAEVALAVATGHLEEFRDRPEYALWRLYADGATTSTGFKRMVAEMRATPAGYKMARVRVVGYSLGTLLHVPQRLSNQLARRPTPHEIAAGYVALIRRGADVLKLKPRR